MEGVLIFWEKMKGLVTSQRFVTTLATLVVSAVVIFNLIMPLFKPDVDQIEVPDADKVALTIGAWIGQAVIAVSFILGMVAQFLKLVQSIQERPPVLTKTWQRPIWSYEVREVAAREGVDTRVETF